VAGSADRALSCCQVGSDRAASVIAKLWLRGTHVNGGGIQSCQWVVAGAFARSPDLASYWSYRTRNSPRTCR
jgi:hypothetical protein